jgi:hypothetical protein
MDMTNERLDDALASRERIAGQITAQIRRQGYYLSQMDPQPHQALVDLRWAAQMASRQLGRPTRTHMTAVGKQTPDKVTVIIAPRDVPTVTEVEFGDRTRTTVEQLLERHDALLAGARPA